LFATVSMILLIVVGKFVFKKSETKTKVDTAIEKHKIKVVETKKEIVKAKKKATNIKKGIEDRRKEADKVIFGK